MACTHGITQLVGSFTVLSYTRGSSIGRKIGEELGLLLLQFYRLLCLRVEELCFATTKNCLYECTYTIEYRVCYTIDHPPPPLRHEGLRRPRREHERGRTFQVRMSTCLVVSYYCALPGTRSGQQHSSTTAVAKA